MRRLQDACNCKAVSSTSKAEPGNLRFGSLVELNRPLESLERVLELFLRSLYDAIAWEQLTEQANGEINDRRIERPHDELRQLHILVECRNQSCSEQRGDDGNAELALNKASAIRHLTCTDRVPRPQHTGATTTPPVQLSPKFDTAAQASQRRSPAPVAWAP